MTDADRIVDQTRRLVRERIAPEVRVWDEHAAYPRAVARESGLTALFVPRGAEAWG
jgi:alkylation response protein AidB-like acyl-CoA dehydrogenase